MGCATTMTKAQTLSKTETTLHCRLCGSVDVSVCLNIKHVPRNIQELLTNDRLKQDRATDIVVHECHACSFTQIFPVLEDDYYDDYLMGMSHSKQMQEFQRNQAQDFIRQFGLSGKKVKEIGCGDGSFLAHLQAAGAKVSAIEPSKKFRTLALEKGFDVEAGYVTQDCSLLHAPFDGFVTRQVLEHVPDINGFLQGIRRNCAEGGVGLIEVPSLEKALRDKRFYDFFPDHVNYFSLKTLRLALELNGFEVLEAKHVMFDEYNVAIVRNPSRFPFQDIQRNIDDTAKGLHHFISACKGKAIKVAMWGAGAKGLSVLATANITNVDMVVDLDPHKQGLYTPVTHLLVQSPEKLRGSDIGVVIITAMAFRHEIERMLKQDYGFSGIVLALGDAMDPAILP